MRILTLFMMSVLIGCDDTTEPTPETPEEPAAETTEPEGQEADRPVPNVPDAIPAPADVAAPPADAQKTDSGLAYKVLTPGDDGERPTEFSTVEVHYTGWTTDGEMFDSSVARGQTTKFPLNRVISGWTEGVQLMTKGEKTRFWIPQDLAYKGRPGPPAGMLVFDIELVDFNTPPAPPAAPEDVAAPPANATVTETGLAYVVITDGGDGPHPAATDRVQVHYTGWTTDGQMFDSSIPREQPATFPLNRVIPGWTEGVQLMSPGDKFRFWIPKELAYNDAPGKPAGMLVFDVELLEIAGQ